MAMLGPWEAESSPGPLRVWAVTIADGKTDVTVHVLAGIITEALDSAVRAWCSQLEGRSDYISVQNVRNARDTGMAVWP